MPTPSDLAAMIKRNHARHERGTVYSTGAYADTTIGNTISDVSLERLNELKQALLSEAQQAFGDEFNEAETAATYQTLLDITDGLDLGDSVTSHAIKFSDREENEPQPKEPSDSPSHGGEASEDADKYVVQIFHDDGVVTGMIAGPVPYARGNALFVSRSPKSAKAEELVIGRSAGQVTRSRFGEETGALRVYHVGEPATVRDRAVRLLDMTPDEFEQERARRAKRLGKRTSVLVDLS